MVKKQSALKTAGKAKLADSGSSKPIDPQNDPSRFWKMNFIAERGFKTERAPDAFTAAVTTLGWGSFIKHRGDFIVPLVREFYQGIPDPKEGKPQTYSVVRGEVVDFSPSAINEFFKLGYHGKALESKVNTWGRDEMEEVRTRICVEDSTWEKFGSEFKLKKLFLCDEATMWFTFIRHSLVPTSHTTFVEKERLIILDAIMEGQSIDVGKLIAKEIEKCRLKTEGNLYFPCLITELCKKAEVEIEAREERRSPVGAIPAIFKPRQRAGAIAHDAIALNHLKKNQQALCKFVKAKFDWEKAVIEKLSRGKEILEPPVFPEWLIEDEVVQEAIPQDERVSKKAAVEELKKRKRGKSPIVKKVKGPVKKKKKVSSEESLNTEDLEVLSEEDEEETRKIMKEVRDSEDEDDSEEEDSGEENPEEEDGSDSEKYDESIQADPIPSPTRPKSPIVPSPSSAPQVVPETPQSEATIPPLNQTVTKSLSPPQQQHPIPDPPQTETQPTSPVVTKEPSPEREPPQQKSQSSEVEAAGVITPDAIASPEQPSQAESVAIEAKSPRLKQRANRSPKTKTHHIAGTKEEAQAMAASPAKDIVEGPIPTGSPEPVLKEKHTARQRKPTYASTRRNPGAKLAAIEEDVVEGAEKEEEPKVQQRPEEEVSEQEQEAASKLAEMMASKEVEAPSASAIASAAIASDQGQKEKKKGKTAKPAQPSRVSARTRSGLIKK